MNKFKEEREAFEAIGNTYAVADGINRTKVTIAGVPCAWFSPDNAPENDIVVYIHGGAFIYGSLTSHAPLVSHIARTLNRRVLLIDYRLAPEHPFPAGIEDCIAVITMLTAENPQITFGIIGDSAGGNIAMSIQLFLREAAGPSAGYTIVISPWVDLTCTNTSYERNKILDTILSQAYLRQCATMYAAGKDLSNPYLSPVNGSFQGLAPVLILCGTHEILQDDAANLYKRLLECQVETELMLFEGALHVWPFTDISSEASQKALNEMAAFSVKYRQSL
ncbi:Acetyl esterase/lipase [Chitinophaga sp. YR627]|uniref:alpha/beta hydrolase n=1 Tax=Chitinophaga sp. YR627 TaxID=1881041 RepID=UPI0008F1A42E|nr:alpha/beta hydrolase [Chitinophaga sp. YR627]SFM78820.1 Acetyl esterase/lipase [Chitinophaga sp. YR627]